jgi:glycosyltransferase involved in cell wall biosynthesis
MHRREVNTHPLSVLYVTDSDTVSGAEHVLFHHLERFAPPGFRAHVYLRATNTRLRRELDARSITYTATQLFSTPVIRTTLRPNELAAFATAFWRVRREIGNLAVREEVDIIHSISYPAALYAAFAARALKLPHIWHEHGIKRIHRFNRPIYRWVGNSCSHVVGPSDAVVARLREAGITPAKLRTVYNGIDLDKFTRRDDEMRRMRLELGLRVGEHSVALIGQLLPHKGHQLLIDAAPAVLRAYPRTKFFFIGALENPPYEAALRTAILAKDLTEHFVFTGWIRDVHTAISVMDMSVVPTLTPEPAALSLMEAMAIGCPLVASRTGGTTELVVERETGLLFEPGNVNQLADRIIEILGDADLRRRLALGGRKRMAEHFSLERHLDEVTRLYERCVVSRR